MVEVHAHAHTATTPEQDIMGGLDGIVFRRRPQLYWNDSKEPHRRPGLGGLIEATGSGAVCPTMGLRI